MLTHLTIIVWSHLTIFLFLQFLTSLIKLILLLKFFHRQNEGAEDKDHRVLLGFSMTWFGQRNVSSVFKDLFVILQASQVALVVKNPPANAGDIRDAGSIPGSGRSPGGGHGNPLQYSCLANPTDRAAWWATVLGVSKSQTRPKQLSTQVEGPGTEACFPE